MTFHSFHRFRNDEAGMALLELLFVLVFLSALFFSTVPFALHAWREIILEREAEYLLADVRYMQCLTRMQEVALEETGHEDTPHAFYLFLCGDHYRLQYSGITAKDIGRHTIVEHDCPEGVQLYCTSRNTNQILFRCDGKAVPSTLKFSYGRGKEEFRSVIITTDGRCRVGEVKSRR